jgi:two-component system, OmpR family, sensor histidine kinase SenX3
MLRRLLPTLVLLLLGLLVLGWGLWRLQHIFSAEAEQARASLAERRETLAQYAAESLRHMLRQHYERAMTVLEAARQDPLTPTEGLYLHERGEQVVPRLARWDMAAEGQARRAYAELLEGSARATEPGGPWAERLALLAQLGRALERRDVARTDHLFSQVLLHRGAFRVATLKDLPYMVVLLERLYEGTQPFPDLMQGLLRDGVATGQGGRVEGLQRQLLLQARASGRRTSTSCASASRGCPSARGRRTRTSRRGCESWPSGRWTCRARSSSRW